MDTAVDEQTTNPSDRELESWDWQAAARAAERTIPWLAKHTDRAQTTVYRYKYGTLTPPAGWLRQAWRLLVAGPAS